MEFKEFTNPERRDYDINSSLNNFSFDNNTSVNFYSEQLNDLIGILEDVTDEELQQQYGISMDEYFNPTEETINKVSENLEYAPDTDRYKQLLKIVYPSFRSKCEIVDELKKFNGERVRMLFRKYRK